MVNRPVPLTREHDVSKFDCGKAPLTDWLKKHALQNHASGHTKTLVIAGENKVVIGYYTYSVVSVEHEEETPQRPRTASR